MALIYRWLSQGLGGVRSDLLEVNRLKRENKELKQMLGQLLLDNNRGKKIEIAKRLVIEPVSKLQ